MSHGSPPAQPIMPRHQLNLRTCVIESLCQSDVQVRPSPWPPPSSLLIGDCLAMASLHSVSWSHLHQRCVHNTSSHMSHKKRKSQTRRELYQCERSTWIMWTHTHITRVHIYLSIHPELLKPISSLLKRSQRCVMAITWSVKNLFFHCAHEEETGINYVLTLINLTNLDGKLEPSPHCTQWLWSFSPTVNLTFSYTYIAAVRHIFSRVLHNWDLRWQFTGQATHDPDGRPLDTPWWLRVTEDMVLCAKAVTCPSLSLSLPACLSVPAMPV